MPTIITKAVDIEETVIAVHLNANVDCNTKHINIGEMNTEDSSMVAYGVLTSSMDKYTITGNPSTFKVSSIKMDGSFITKPYVTTTDLEDINFVGGFSVSQTTAGQRMRVFEEPKTYKKDEYVVSELGMDYLTNQPKAEENIKIIIEISKEVQKQKSLRDENNTDNEES